MRIAAVVTLTAHHERMPSRRLNHLDVGEKNTVEPKSMDIIERVELDEWNLTSIH